MQNPLTGERGASRVFGPQKGADARMVEALDAGLAHLADVVSRDLGYDFRNTPGAGAAGGLGFGLLSFCGAQIRSGFETIAGILQLEAQIAACDLVLTGEGRLDPQTLEGKGPAGVAALARRHGKPVVAFAGAVADDPRCRELFAETFAITPVGMPLDEAMRNAASLLEERVAQAALDAGWEFMGHGYFQGPMHKLDDQAQAIAAVVIGGTSLMGGRGSVVNSFFGVLIISVLGAGLAQVGAQEPTKRLITGLVILAAVLADKYRQRA